MARHLAADQSDSRAPTDGGSGDPALPGFTCYRAQASTQAQRRSLTLRVLRCCPWRRTVRVARKGRMWLVHNTGRMGDREGGAASNAAAAVLGAIACRRREPMPL